MTRRTLAFMIVIVGAPSLAALAATTKLDRQYRSTGDGTPGLSLLMPSCFDCLSPPDPAPVIRRPF